MKKTSLLLLAALVLVIGVFIWLLMEASPENAPQETITVELPDSYEN